MDKADIYLYKLNHHIHGKIFEIINKFIKDNNLLIDNTPIEENNFTYQLYSSNALVDANNLANILATETPYVEMLTNIPYRKFTLQVNNKYICSIYTLGYFKKQPIQKLLNLTDHVPYELELSEIYHKLYNVKYNADWDKLLIHEEQVRAEKIHGGKDMNFIQSLNCLLIGTFALEKFGIHEKGRLQLISNNVEQTIESLKNISDFEVFDLDPVIPFDFRLQKKTLKSDTTVIDIYNSCEFEIVPYVVVDNLKVAHPYVICRFLLIDYWLSLLLKNPNKQILYNINKIRNKTIPVEHFYGTYRNEDIDLKKMHQDNSFQTYYPKKYFDKNGAYREIKK